MQLTCKIDYLHNAVVSMHATGPHEGKEVQVHSLLSSALYELGLSASRPDRYTPGERVPGTHCNIKLGGSHDRPGRFGGEKSIVLGSNGTIPVASSPQPSHFTSHAISVPLLPCSV
jgi:hypothetical protein